MSWVVQQLGTRKASRYMCISHRAPLNRCTYSGKSYWEFIQERIFDSLCMASTTYFPVKAQASGNFSQIWSTASAGRRIPYWIQDEGMEEFIAGAGGIISSTGTTVDMASPDVASEILGL